MNDENRAGWYALYLSITQNITPARSIAIMEGRRNGIRPLSWDQFLTVYREGEAKLRAAQSRHCRSEKVRNYQREYRRIHPLTEAQRASRREYLKAYRAAHPARRKQEVDPES